MQVFHVVSILATGLAATASAEQVCDSATWRERLHSIAANTRLEMPYSEERSSRILTDPQFSSGTLSYDPATGTMTKQIEEPEQASLQVRGRKLTIVRRGKTRRVRLPKDSSLQWTLNAIAALAAGKLPELTVSHQLQCSGNESDWSVQLTPLAVDKRAPARNGMQELSSLQISGAGNELMRFITIMKNGDRTVLSRIPGRAATSTDASGD